MLDKLGAPSAFNGPVSARLGDIWPVIASSEGNCKSSSLKVTKIDCKPNQDRIESNGIMITHKLEGQDDKINTIDELSPNECVQEDLIEEPAKEANKRETSQKTHSLDPSLALDGLEIAWEELILKERIGAGMPLLSVLDHSIQSTRFKSEIWMWQGHSGQCIVLIGMAL